MFDKTRNVILGAIASVFAVTSALASLTMNPPQYISVKYEGAQDFTCIEIDANECHGWSGPLCKIIVATTSGDKLAQVFNLDADQVTCTTALWDYHTIGTYSTGSMPITAVREKP